MEEGRGESTLERLQLEKTKQNANNRCKNEEEAKREKERVEKELQEKWDMNHRLQVEATAAKRTRKAQEFEERAGEQAIKQQEEVDKLQKRAQKKANMVKKLPKEKKTKKQIREKAMRWQDPKPLWQSMWVALQQLKVQEERYQEYKDGFATSIQECIQTLQMIDCITDHITCEVNAFFSSKWLLSQPHPAIALPAG